jgi:hypothetical protein
MNSWSSPLGGSIKTATRFETPLCTRSAASSAPAPSESSDKRMMSAGGDRVVVYDKRPSCGSQNRLPKGANSNDRKRGQRERRQDRSPRRPPEDLMHWSRANR